MYRAYGSQRWKSREAYQNRLYYKAQLSSKTNYANERYWALDRELEGILNEKYLKFSYDGKATRKANRIEARTEKRDFWEKDRWRLDNLPRFLRDRL